MRQNGTHPLFFYGRKLDIEHFNQRNKVLGHYIGLPRLAIDVDVEVSEFEPSSFTIPKAGEQGRQMRYLGGHFEVNRFEAWIQDNRILPSDR